MRVKLLAIASFVVISFVAKAQVYPGTVGLRLSASNYGFGPELSYQHGLSDADRIEAGIGINTDLDFTRFGITAAYHLVFAIEGGFNWFAGPGAQLWLYSYTNAVALDNNVGGAIGGQFGIEYDFDELDLPFVAAVDARPVFNFVSGNSGLEFALGVSARYVF